MKRFTIVGSILTVLLMIRTLVYVGMSPDFVAPGEGGPGGEDTDSLVWGMSIEDLVDYLEAKGLWSREDMLPIAAGVATEAYVCNGAEIYWWDVDNLEEGSNEAAAYQDIVNGDPINLYQQGQSYMPVTRNGPFAIFTGAYNGDVDVILDAFTSFGQGDGGEAVFAALVVAFAEISHLHAAESGRGLHRRLCRQWRGVLLVGCGSSGGGQQ